MNTIKTMKVIDLHEVIREACRDLKADYTVGADLALVIEDLFVRADNQPALWGVAYVRIALSQRWHQLSNDGSLSLMGVLSRVIAIMSVLARTEEEVGYVQF